MPIDAYSFCPCGTGKKIKFCCPDLLSELQKIDRMLEGEQNLGCLKHIEQVQRKEPDRACLFAIKGMVLRMTGQLDEARANAATFLDKHPDSATALAESAIVAAMEQGGRAAVGYLQRALAAANGEIQSRTYEAMGAVAEVLVAQGEYVAARALLQLQAAIAKEDRRPIDTLLHLYQLPSVPLLLKEDPPLAICPDDAPWKPQFVEAMAPIQLGTWQVAADKLDALATEVPDSAVIWQDLAILRGWLADRPGGIEAWRKFASLEVPLEDAVEAETRAMFLSDDVLGDQFDMLSVTWTIEDVEKLEAALKAESRALEVPVDRSALGEEDAPPPKAAFALVDRPIPDTAEDVSLDTVARFLGQVVLYGRQTDREALLELIGVTAAKLEQTKALLREIAGDALAKESEEKVLGRISASENLLHHKWRAPKDATPEQLESLVADHQRDALLNRWPQLPLGVLDGKSPREAAGDQGHRARLLAAVMVLEYWSDGIPGRFDFNQLRTELALPTLDPIDPEQSPMAGLPLTRLHRVTAEKAVDADLMTGFRRAAAFSVDEALLKFAKVVIDRPTLSREPDRLRAYNVLVRMAEDPETALRYLAQGREAAMAAGQSCASWDLQELPLRLARLEGPELSRLVNHIQSQHMNEPGVAAALQQFLIQIGAIRPDGAPTAPPMAAPAAAGDQPAAEPGKIWTPGDAAPSGEKKLWTPD